MLTNQNKQQVEDWFKILKDQICKSFEEIEDQFNSVVIAYRDILLSLNFPKIISLWSIPAVRHKDASISPENKERPMRSELPHSDTWIGWDKNSILINIPNHF